MTTHGRERGSATFFVLAWVVVLVAVAGLVYDGGRRLAAEQAAADTAQEAARSGAQSLTAATLSGDPIIDPALARRTALEYLDTAGYTGAASIAGDRIIVTAQRSRPTGFLRAFGIDSFTVSATATVQALTTSGPGRP
jgi:hypothetical protein